MNNEVVKEPMKREYKLAIIICVVTVVCTIFGLSFALFSGRYEGEELNTITSGTIVLELDDTVGNAINLSAAIPVEDSVGLSTDPYTFEVRNIGDNTVNYTLSLIDDEDAYVASGSESNKLPWSVVKYSLIKDGVVVVNPSILSTNNGVIELGNLAGNATGEYELRLWLDGEGTTASHMGMHFHAKLKLNATIG